MKMVCTSWLFVIVMVHLCIPGFGSVRQDSANCRDLSDKKKLLDCIHQCLSAIQTELPEVNGNDLLPSMLLAGLTSEDETESNLNVRSDVRRSRSMQHFRWAKPTAEKHLPTAVEESAPYEAAFPHQARRHLSGVEDLGLQSHRPLKVMVSPKTHILPSPPERKDATYRMSHFRWGSPPASKRSEGSFIKLWEDEDPLVKIFRNIMEQDDSRRRA
ncbi:pro-opiomelanocortin B-like [Thalassophryne amazonica]|uniref:pro-opiomelanocortin B-like n=1 Tax=Thalassophryne amazonica TaxID=390379 RepID=UPI001470BB10|nr:pro-opiomelanocortin B-like [Thalassophryne amazonica]XP_034018264.1 pro-opiomelanocortin B-like [Thalassophryne amazonica]